MENEQTIHPEKIILLGCVNEETVKSIDEQFGSDNTIVRLNDEVVVDYVRQQSVKDLPEENKFQEFITNKTNRAKVCEKALTLWNILTKNSEITKKRVFTKQELVKRTTLTFPQATELLELFGVFGLIKYSKGRYEFEFCFDKKTQQDSIHAEILEKIGNLNLAIASYKDVMKSDDKISDIVLSDKLIDLHEEINKLIEI
jgi:hypothetical protein